VVRLKGDYFLISARRSLISHILVKTCVGAHFLVVELNTISIVSGYLRVVSGDLVHRDIIRVTASSIEVKQHSSEHWSVSMYRDAGQNHYL